MPRLRLTPDATISDKIDDASITAQVKSSLLSHHSTSAIHTGVSTTDGVVTLTGIAKNEAEKSLVTKLATDINGVTSVINNMTIAVPVAEPTKPSIRCWLARKRASRQTNSKESFMLYTIAVILLVLWLLGLVSGYTIGGFVHVLLVIAIIMVLVNFISGRRRLN